jgi:hypothetical protein
MYRGLPKGYLNQVTDTSNGMVSERYLDPADSRKVRAEIRTKDQKPICV